MNRVPILLENQQPAIPPPAVQQVPQPQPVRNLDLNLPANPPQQQEPIVNEVRVRGFQKLKPLTFSAGIDPIKANEWLESVEKIFLVMRCTKVEKVALAAYNLTGEAQRWWTLMLKTEPRMEWTCFLVVFNQKHIPQSIKDSKSMEFQNLKQRG